MENIRCIAGNPLAVGDDVLIAATVESVNSDDPHANLVLRTKLPMPGPRGGHRCEIRLNAQQCVLWQKGTGQEAV